MPQMQICSGCDNLVEIGEQYCSECKNDIAQGDWEDSHEPDYPCDHDWQYSDDAGGYVCRLCDLLESDPSYDEPHEENSLYT